MASLRSAGIAALGTTSLFAGMGPAYSQSAGDQAEIAALKQQLRVMEEKLDKLRSKGTPMPPPWSPRTPPRGQRT